MALLPRLTCAPTDPRITGSGSLRRGGTLQSTEAMEPLVAGDLLLGRGLTPALLPSRPGVLRDAAVVSSMFRLFFGASGAGCLPPSIAPDADTDRQVGLSVCNERAHCKIPPPACHLQATAMAPSAMRGASDLSLELEPDLSRTVCLDDSG